MNVYIVDRDHADANLHCLKLARGLRRFMGNRLILKRDTHRAVVAAAPDGTIVGMLRYTRRGIRCLRSVRALGTYVSKSHRGQGLSLALWQAMLAEETPRTVRVTTVSKGGHGLISALQRADPSARIIEHNLS